MTFWVRSALVFLAAALAMNTLIPIYLDRFVFSRLTFHPPVSGPEPDIKPFLTVAQDLAEAPDIQRDPDGAFRVDYRAHFTAGGNPKETQNTIDAIAADHCRMLLASFAATCGLETMQSTLRVGALDHNGPRDAEVFMRFVVGPKRSPVQRLK